MKMLLLGELIIASHSLLRTPAIALGQKIRTGRAHMLPGEQSGSHVPARPPKTSADFSILFLGNNSSFFLPATSKTY